jgi:hypothetical protein
MNRSSAPFVLAALAGSAVAPCAFAQILLPEVTRWTVPDLDQRRSGLANSGNNHCVPTSHINMLAYINDHGFHLALHNVTNSYWASEYDDLTDNIHDLGVLMGTTGSGGTSGQGCIDGMTAWLGGLGFLYNVNYQWGPDITPSDLYWSIAGGGVSAFCYGRWEYINANNRYERTGGGHCVTTRAVKDYRFPLQPDANDPLIKYRDPAADEGDIFHQSPFATSEYRLHRRTANFKGYGITTMWEMLTGTGDQYRRCIDGFTSISPIFVLQPDTSVNMVKLKTVVHMIDSQEEGGFALNNIADVAFGITSHHVFAISAVNSDISRLVLGNPLGGGITHTIDIPGSTGRKIAPGVDGEVFLALGGLLRCYRPADDGGFTEVHTPATLPIAPTALCFDDLRHGPAVLMGDGSVREYDKTLGTVVVKTLATPPGWPPTTGPSFQRIVPGHAQGDYWFGPLAGGLLKRYTPAPGVPTRLVLAETVTPPAGLTLTDFDLTDDGSLLLKRGGVLQVLKKNAAGGWDVDNGHPFTGLALPGGSALLRMSRSRNNFDPAIHDDPQWKTDVPNPQPLGPETPDCIADVGRVGGIAEPDGLLNNNDFVVFIDWFFTLDQRADIGSVGGLPGADGQFNNNDFVVFIDRFFQGCP